MSGATTIHKCTRNRGYTKVSNLLMQDKLLSYKARGLMCYFLSLPDDWVIHIETLYTKDSHEGKYAIREAMKELTERGYLHLELAKDEKTGKIAGRRWLAFDDPSENPHHKCKTDARVFPPSGKSTVGSLATTKEREETKERERQKKEIAERKDGTIEVQTILSPSATEQNPNRGRKAPEKNETTASQTYTDADLLAMSLPPRGASAILRWHRLRGTNLED